MAIFFEPPEGGNYEDWVYDGLSILSSTTHLTPPSVCVCRRKNTCSSTCQMCVCSFCQMFVCALSVAGSASIAIAKARQQVYNAARCTAACKAEGGADVIVSCVAQCAALYNSAVESIHVVDKSGHECQNLSIEHGFIAIKQWPRR